MARSTIDIPPYDKGPLSANIASSQDYEFKRFTDVTNVTVTGGATTSFEDIDGVTCLKVVTASGTQSEIQFTGMPDVTPPMMGRPCMVANIVDPSKVTSCVFFWSPAGYPAKWWQQTYTIKGSVYAERGGWWPFQLSPGWGTAVGGFTWGADTVSDCKFRITPESGQQATVYFHSLRFLPRTRPVFVIGFDDNRDGLVSAKANVYIRGVSGTHSGKDVLDEYGFNGTLWVVREQVSDEGFYAGTGGLSWAQINTLKNAGWDVQAQGYKNPVGTNEGHKLLGPYGYSSRGISSVSTAANTITCSAAHNMPTAGTYGYPVEFTGTDLPSPLVAGTQYWLRQTSSTAFQVHETEQDSIDNTNIVDLTTTGTAANFGFRYWGSANDDSAILADYQSLISALQANCNVTPKHLATNQGAIDHYVYTAAKDAGFKTIRPTRAERFSPSFLSLTLQQLVEPWVTGNTIYCEDTATYSSQSVMNTAVDNWIADGGIAQSFLHQFPNGSQQFDWLCQRLEYWQQRGRCEVMTISEAYDFYFTSPRVASSGRSVASGRSAATGRAAA